MKNHRFSAILILVFWPAFLFCQKNPVADSLERVLLLPQPDSAQVLVLTKLAAIYSRFDMRRAEEKLEKATRLTEFYSNRWADSLSFFRHRAAAVYTHGNLLYRQGKYAESQPFYFEALKFFEKTGDELGIGKASNSIGTAFYYFSDFEKALEYDRRAEKIFEKIGFLNGLLTAQSNIASALEGQGKTWEANQKQLEIAEHAEKNGLWDVAGGNYLNILGNYVENVDSLEKSLFYAQKAEKMLEKTNDMLNKGLLFGRFAIIYYLKKDFEKSEKYGQEALEIGFEIKNKLVISMAYNNLAVLFLEKAKQSKSPVEKDSFFLKAFDFNQKERVFNDSIFNSEKSQQLAEAQVNYETEKKEREISQLTAAAKNREIENLQNEVELRQQKINAERAREQALILEKSNENIALELEVNAGRLREQQVFSAQKQKDIELLQLKNAQQQAEADREKQLRFGLILGILGLAVFSFLMWWLFRQRVLANRKIQNQQAEIQIQNQKLAEANRYKSIFLSNMSHEIRTPLNTIIGMSGLLAETRLEPKQKEFAEIVKNASENLLSIINEILDFSKIEAGKIEIHPQNFDLHELLARQFNLIKLNAEQKRLVLRLDLAPDLPKNVLADPARLNQILLNLLGNAVKFTEKGSILLHAHVRETLADGRKMLQFSVSDTGIGIAPGELPQIFEAFKQVGETTHLRHGGTGLGLAIAKNLVEIQGGEIWVESKTSVGTNFSFTLPVEIAESLAPQFSKPPQLSKPSKLKILLVEDNHFNQLLAVELIQKLVIEPKITIAENGLEAQKQAAAAQFDLIFMDVKMPIMDGFAATAALRKSEILTPIIALTANATAEEKENCLAAGMDDYISKPISIQILEEKIRRWTTNPISQ